MAEQHDSTNTPVSPAAHAPEPPESTASQTSSASPVSPAIAPTESDTRWPGAFKALSLSLSQLLNNPVPALVYGAASAIIAIGSYFASSSMEQSTDIGTSILSSGASNTLALVTIVVFLLANRTYALAIADKRAISFSEYMRFDTSRYVCLAVAGILIYMMSIFSIILLFIPLIWIVGWLLMTQYVAAERGGDPIQAMKESKRLSKGHMGKIWGIIGASILIVIFLIIPIIFLAIIPHIGLIALTFAFAFFELTIAGAHARLYRWLQKNQAPAVTGGGTEPGQPAPPTTTDPTSPISPANVQ